ncbi:hypothetical protein B0H12DRAFT_1073880 [Mycena haematopus]|nr:hypothetical protein B0H12DRAFT_1073880 [Mycena haematopus]
MFRILFAGYVCHKYTLFQSDVVAKHEQARRLMSILRSRLARTLQSADASVSSASTPPASGTAKPRQSSRHAPLYHQDRLPTRPRRRPRRARNCPASCRRPRITTAPHRSLGFRLALPKRGGTTPKQTAHPTRARGPLRSTPRVMHVPHGLRAHPGPALARCPAAAALPPVRPRQLSVAYLAARDSALAVAERFVRVGVWQRVRGRGSAFPDWLKRDLREPAVPILIDLDVVHEEVVAPRRHEGLHGCGLGMYAAHESELVGDGVAAR